MKSRLRRLYHPLLLGWAKIKASFKASKKDPTVPDKGYPQIVNYLIDSAESDIGYYTLVLCIGLLGIFIAAICATILVALHWKDWTKVLKKEYPAFLGGFITTAFGQIEIQQKKLDLYRKLKDVAEKEGAILDAGTLTDSYKSWTIQEFQDRFKPST